MKRIIAPGAIIILMFIAGCAHLSQRAPLSLDRISIAQIRDNLEQNNLRYRSMMGYAEISVESPTINFTALSKIVSKKGDTLLIQIKAPFGISAATIYVDPTRFVVINSFDNCVYYGNPQTANLKQFLPIDVQLEDLFQLFSGLHRLGDADNETLAIDDNQYRVEQTNEDHILQYWIDPQKFMVTGFQLLNLNKEKLISLEYKQFEKVDKLYLPKFVQITQPDRKTRLTILYSDRNINCRLEGKDFYFKIPDQAKKIKL